MRALTSINVCMVAVIKGLRKLGAPIVRMSAKGQLLPIPQGKRSGSS